WQGLHIFLADLNGQPDAYYLDKAAFFGAGGPRQPDAIRLQRTGDEPATAKSHCLVMRRTLTIQPGQAHSLRFAYGAVRPVESTTFLEQYRQQQHTAAE